MECPGCHAANREGSAFCTACGALLSPACPSCGAEITAGDRFCSSCGGRLSGDASAPQVLGRFDPQPLSRVAEKVLGGRERRAGERRSVTVLFTDMKGYTPTAEKLGEENTYLVMRRVLDTMMESVQRHQGTVHVLTGDGLMALFGEPVALEDSPLRACRTALDIQTKMKEVGPEIEAEHGVHPRLRIGIHTGPIVVGEVGSDLGTEITALGDTVNLASRLASAGEPGGVLMSEATHRLVEGHVEASFAGERALKGKTEPQRVYRLDGLKAGVTRFDVAVSRGLTEFVGRQGELETLERCWDEAASGMPRLVDVVGEAGIGKSRLIHEFRQRLGGDGAFFVQGNCTADGYTTAFLPFIELVRGSFRIAEGAERTTIERNLRRGLEILGLSVEDTLPYLMNLLGQADEDSPIRHMAAEVVGIRTREAIQNLLRERCRLSPTVMVIEDLHWIDTASEEFLEWAADAQDGMPLLVLCAYRPSYRPSWADRSNVTEVRLEPLTSNRTVDLLKRRFGVDELPREFARLVVDKAEGNPLFVEEIANYLVEKGSVETQAGVVTFQAGGEETALPVTLANLLMDRVDRLDEGPRAVLQTASVIGRRFSSDLACTVSEINGAAADYVRELERQELIYPEVGAGEYRFKHALVQDAVYESLLTARREELHERVAEALEHQHANRLPEVADVLAHHYSHTPRAEKAVRYLALAGEKSLGVYSLEEAESCFRQALELMEVAPGCADDAFLADVLLNVARIHYLRADFKSIIALVDRYLPRVEALGDKMRLSRFLFEGGYAHVYAAKPETGKALLQRALNLGEEIGNDEAIGYACLGLAYHYSYWEPAGEDRRATFRRLAERALEIGRRIGDVWLTSRVLAAFNLEGTIWGRPHESKHFDLQLFELGRETGDPRPKSIGLSRLAYTCFSSGDYEEAIEHAEESIQLSLSPIDRLVARHGKGISLIMAGRLGEGFDVLRQVRREMEAGEVRLMDLSVETLYGAALVSSGEMARGIRLIADTVERNAQWGQPYAHAYGHYLLGNIYLRMVLGNHRPELPVILRNLGFLLRTLPVAARKARGHLEAAVKEARNLEMPAHLAKSLCDLGLLHKAKKRQAEARGCLEEARGIAESVEAATLCDKINAALQSLD